mmetsp:Transcript_35506/g.66281  ORF Transcript_35506/g.66281 Transcript_35506/m.66281 type:complete len:242 (+) Transcript_35506:813-1538(+)
MGITVVSIAADKLRVGGVTDVHHVQSPGARLGAHGIQESRGLIDHNIVGGAKLSVNHVGLVLDAEVNMTVGGDVVVLHGVSAVRSRGSRQLMQIEHLHAMIRGLRTNVDDTLVHLHVSPAGGDSLSGDVAHHHGVQRISHIHERRSIRAASHHILVARLVGPAPDVISITMAIQIGQGDEGKKVNARASVFTSEAINALGGTGRCGVANESSLLLGLPAQTLLLHITIHLWRVVLAVGLQA